MRVIAPITMLGLATAVCFAASARAAEEAEEAKVQREPSAVELKTDAEKLGYAIGIRTGRSLKTMAADGVEFSIESYFLGIQDALDDREPALPEDEARALLQELREAARARSREFMMKHRMEVGEKNRAEGEAFLAENAKKEGVVVLDSGLQYEVIEEGTGRKPTDTDKVRVHYRATLLDGTEFDSSSKHGPAPAEFAVSGSIIAGWKEALKLMKEGAKWRIYIPPQLAYGARAQGPIMPHATLIFDLELIEIVK
ncbi:MAG TPA: FKBP-type peptidyl-prolyl cis-trans isomerase [Candidatus Hydrogenedentes bacterium]|nr:FKBP-type peptidyl-prolyl cis-trans isomerase [Candidatus Hydrogenedentota bacterium]